MIKVCAVQVKIIVNPSAKWLHITILEMDTPLGGTRMQSIRGVGTPETYNSPPLG